jgi:hypothetical protein
LQYFAKSSVISINVFKTMLLEIFISSNVLIHRSRNNVYCIGIEQNFTTLFNEMAF